MSSVCVMASVSGFGSGILIRLALTRAWVTGREWLMAADVDVSNSSVCLLCMSVLGLASILYLGEVVCSSGGDIVDTVCDCPGVVIEPVWCPYVARASKGVGSAAVDLSGVRVARFPGNLGTVMGGTGDASIGATVVSSV